MTAKHTSIAQTMLVVALVALNLGAIRACPKGIVEFPTFWVFLGVLDFLAIWKLILKRPLQAFHYTFLVVFVMAWIFMANLVATERFNPLRLLVRWYQMLASENENVVAFVDSCCSKFLMACFLSFMLACILGIVAAWLERCRSWDIAAFHRGAFTGFALANLLALIDGAVWGWVVVSPARMLGRLVLLGTCVVLGGLLGISRLKSNTQVEKLPVLSSGADVPSLHD